MPALEHGRSSGGIAGSRDTPLHGQPSGIARARVFGRVALDGRPGATRIGGGQTVVVVGGQRHREAAALANYASTANLEKRQTLFSFVTAVDGRHKSEFIGEIAPGSQIVDVGCGNG